MSLHITNPKYSEVFLRGGTSVMDEKKFEHGMLKAGFSGVVAIGWLVFLILFLAFYSGGFRTNEKFALILLSVLVLTVVLGGSWAVWSLRILSKKEWEVFRIKGFRWRILGSICYGFGVLVVLIYGFWFVWTDFNFWQYLAVLLVVLLVSGGFLGAVWASWSSRYGDEMERCGEDIGKKFEKGFKESFEGKEEKGKE